MQSRWCAHIWRMHSSLPLPPPAPPAPSTLSTLDHTVKTQHQKVTVSKTGGKIHIGTFPLIPHQRDVHRDEHSAPFLYFLWLNMSKSAFFIFWLDNHLHIVISSTIFLYFFLFYFHCGSPPAVIRHISLFTIMFRKLKSTMLCQIDWFVSIFIPSFQHCLVPQWPSLVTGIIKVSFYLPKAVGVSK